MNRIRLGIAGVGARGRAHAEAAWQLAAEGLVRVTACALPDELLSGLAPHSRDLRRYDNADEMLAGEPDIQAVCLATPAASRYGLALGALRRGVHVLTDPPPALSLRRFRELESVRESAGAMGVVAFSSVGFPMVCALKRRLCEGALGRIVSVRAEVRRTGPCAEEACAPGEGEWLADGALCSEAGEALNLCAYLTGEQPHEFARPLWVQAERYRCGAGEPEDTACLRAGMDTGVEVCVHVTRHASRDYPLSCMVLGERGTATCHEVEGVAVGVEHFAPGEEEPTTTTILRRLVEVAQGSDEPLLMPLAEAEGYVLLLAGARGSAPAAAAVQGERLARGTGSGQPATVIEGIDEVVAGAAAEGRLLSECGVPWAVGTEVCPLEGM